METTSNALVRPAGKEHWWTRGPGIWTNVFSLAINNREKLFSVARLNDAYIGKGRDHADYPE